MNSIPSHNFTMRSKRVFLRNSNNVMGVLNEAYPTKKSYNNIIHHQANTIKTVNDESYISHKKKEISENSYNPNNNNKKILALIATHVNTELKLDTAKKTIKRFNFNCVDIMVANSTSLSFNGAISEFCKKNNVSYDEVENIPTYDFGKWVYLLSKINYLSYDYIFFINDSFIIEKPITHFINLAIKTNVELYGYNDSTQRNYHYQSYLFSIKSNAIHKFIHMFNSKKKLIKSQEDLITNYELKLTDYFSTHDCFLKIGNIFNRNTNIFFHNDYLYQKLKNAGVLPFTKIKRILQDSSK